MQSLQSTIIEHWEVWTSQLEDWPSNALSSGVSCCAIPEEILKQSCLLVGGVEISLSRLAAIATKSSPTIRPAVRSSLAIPSAESWMRGCLIETDLTTLHCWSLNLPWKVETRTWCHSVPSGCFSSLTRGWLFFGCPEHSPQCSQPAELKTYNASHEWRGEGWEMKGTN